MQVETKTLGKVDVQNENLIEFPFGLFGFEDYHRYALLNAEYAPFYYLQSIDEKKLAFILVDPFLVANDYEIDVDDLTLSKIEVSSPSDVCTFAIVTIPSSGVPITANLQGPLVINRKNKKALQIVLTDSKWTTKHDVLAAISEKKFALKNSGGK